ncbi:MAG: DUF3581 domain-containing protein [Gammaproteobacteria bacterium]|jgi:hypothetical protein|nr:DUF3581 domain-containing protein [Gammaproteobacteria bacterium]MDH5172058.1 DUF3581 domain-containing protein [Gammaproteobacteria bacterium]
MLIDSYYTASNGKISFTREQGSNFAKQVADDFNPIHDPDARRFCIPGDLLFAIILAEYGLSQHMEFTFTGMVVDGIELVLPEPAPELAINDTEGRQYLTIHSSGDNTRNASLIDTLTRSYVEFSGHTFPHILVPLLAGENVMINPDRPVVMYDSMSIDLDRLDIGTVSLEIDRSTVSINGKRGEVRLAFNLLESGSIVGRGRKRMILSGLRPYEKQAMDDITAEVNQRKLQFRRL